MSEKTPHSVFSHMPFSRTVCARVGCPGPAPRDQPAGSQCRAVSEKCLTTLEPKISAPRGTPKLTFLVFHRSNRRSQAAGSLALLHLPETIITLQEKYAHVLTCNFSYAREMERFGKDLAGFFLTLPASGSKVSRQLGMQSRGTGRLSENAGELDPLTWL